jgi:hypothetical protein
LAWAAALFAIAPIIAKAPDAAAVFCIKRRLDISILVIKGLLKWRYCLPRKPATGINIPVRMLKRKRPPTEAAYQVSGYCVSNYPGEPTTGRVSAIANAEILEREFSVAAFKRTTAA